MPPGIGGQIGPYLHKGEWQIDGNFTRFETGDEYRGYDQRQDHMSTGTQVLEGGDTLDLQGAYGLTRRINLTVDAPIVLWSHWSTVLAGTRYDQKAHGLADIMVGGRMWLFNCESHTDQNLALGLALRLPTGESNYQVPYPNSQGKDISDRPVFPAIQPGSGAWGLRLSVEGFRQFRHLSVYGTGMYLFSLKSQNDTLALGAALNPAGPQAVAANLRYLSTPDSYLFNAGVAVPIPHVRGIAALFAGRIVGVPVYNVLTSTSGFRQPGYFVTVNPGLSWDTRFASYNITVPLRVHQYVGPDFTGSPKNSDFTKTQFQVGVMFHLGGGRHESPGDLGTVGANK